MCMSFPQPRNAIPVCEEPWKKLSTVGHRHIGDLFFLLCTQASLACILSFALSLALLHFTLLRWLLLLLFTVRPYLCIRASTISIYLHVGIEIVVLFCLVLSTKIFSPSLPPPTQATTTTLSAVAAVITLHIIQKSGENKRSRKGCSEFEREAWHVIRYCCCFGALYTAHIMWLCKIWKCFLTNVHTYCMSNIIGTIKKLMCIL